MQTETRMRPRHALEDVLPCSPAGGLRSSGEATAASSPPGPTPTHAPSALRLCPLRGRCRHETHSTLLGPLPLLQPSWVLWSHLDHHQTSVSRSPASRVSKHGTCIVEDTSLKGNWSNCTQGFFSFDQFRNISNVPGTREPIVCNPSLCTRHETISVKQPINRCHNRQAHGPVTVPSGSTRQGPCAVTCAWGTSRVPAIWRKRAVACGVCTAQGPAQRALGSRGILNSKKSTFPQGWLSFWAKLFADAVTGECYNHKERARKQRKCCRH